MNIVLHIPSLKTGGAERQLTLLAKGLADRSHDVHVVTFFEGGLFWDELSRDSRIRLFSLERRGKWDFFIVSAFRRYLKDNDIQLVQAFLPPGSVIAALTTVFLPVALVVGIRASDMRFRFGARIYKYAERLLGNRLAACYICNSYSGKEYSISTGYDQRKISVIPNGLSVPGRSYIEPLSRQKPIYLAMASRLVPMKDIPTMLRALAMLKQRFEGIELRIYGDGDDVYKQELYDLSRQLGVDDAVSWQGWAPSIWEIFEDIDIMVSSSSSGEGMSNILMEAMLAGRIIVSTDVGDARRLLDGEDGKAGYLVPKSDHYALCDALSDAIDHPKTSLEYASSGRDVIVRHYSVTAMVDAYDKLYEKILR